MFHQLHGLSNDLLAFLFRVDVYFGCCVFVPYHVPRPFILQLGPLRGAHGGGGGWGGAGGGGGGDLGYKYLQNALESISEHLFSKLVFQVVENRWADHGQW